ncbi:MAG: hypothetical protein CO146_02645 [Candidatus Nealsonbacteria bacterium CG_4_9_14_3_um_filter_37_29]|uniref:Uncharacterized protein n=1 Tax=Candidatus Nealsonbacteria bacterium CG_4_9_14_3_um_filter_37_29 TaxID=1974696 RepID=A0A2M7Z2Q8_9BACT|nr:MAG: hypothetical protein CO146_02645 [Candidatus Nealsonbacteria bacterium CG_4_9_14_3_um_filter_37_29]
MKKSGREPANADNFVKIIGDMEEIRQLMGSCYDDGNVPNANWNSGKFKVNWYNPDNVNDNLCSRQKFPKRQIPY